MNDGSREAAADVAREANGRLVAMLARRCGDISLAEDAFADALAAALERWPRTGVPDEPEAWIFAVATRRLVGQWRKTEVRQRKARALRALHSVDEERQEGESWPDERVALMFVCAHPAIDETIRAPLMLQTVLGLTAEELAPLFALPAKTLGQRLWRAKTKIRETRIPFALPDNEALGPRLQAVLDALYGLYGFGWRLSRPGERRDALWLARLVAQTFSTEPEVAGLCALLGYIEARRDAGRVDGVFVPFDAQDLERWDAPALRAADAELRRAAALMKERAESPGSFQLEAALQSALVHGRLAGRVDHDAIMQLYDALVLTSPTLGLKVGRAAAIAERDGASEGLRALDALDGVETFQPYWAVRASCLQRLGAPCEDAFERAITLCPDEAVRAYLSDQRTRLST